MKTTILSSGSLEIHDATTEERLAIKGIMYRHGKGDKAEAIFVSRFMKGYKKVLPEDIGALTSCTIIEKDGKYWGDMNYQVRSCLEDLASGKSTIWQSAE